jgi:peroxiredoxin
VRCLLFNVIIRLPIKEANSCRLPLGFPRQILNCWMILIPLVSCLITEGVVVLGVSPDDVKSHAKFKRKFQLPFPLLADEGHRVCDLYQVWGPKKFMGREYEGVLRTTFLIDENGMILKVFEQVRPAEHSEEVLSALGVAN